MIAVIAGGVGAARLLSGLVQVVPPSEITAIVNVADDFVLHGLKICPDLDTVRSTLAGDVGPQGWGRANETWVSMSELRTLANSAPAGSRATDWFSLGDRDLAVHLYRSQRLAEGATLVEISLELCRAQGVATQLLPVTNDVVATHVRLDSGEWVDFQHYFVGLRHSTPITSVRFDGAEASSPAPGVIEAISGAEQVIIAPSNPFVSLGPVLAVPGVSEALAARRSATTAVSPIVGGDAIKGPAARMFRELDSEASVMAVAGMWKDYCSRLVIDDVDAASAAAITDLGVEAIVTDTIMKNSQSSARLAEQVLSR